MELYITRHGQTKANVGLYMQGQSPGELTSEGCNQAKKFGIYYKNIKFDEIYCSDLLRAKKTLEIILNENINKENSVIYSENLREINVQSLVNKPCSLDQKLRNNPPEKYRFNLTDKNDETFIDVFYRISQFLDGLIHKNISENYNSGINKENVYKLNEEANKISADNFFNLYNDGKLTYINKNDKILKKILILCHGGAISEIMNNILYRLKKNVTVKKIKSENTCLYIVKIFPKENKKIILSDKDLIYSFDAFNDISHLYNNK